MLSLSATVLLVISLASAVTFYISNSLFAKKISKTDADYYVYMIIQGAVCAVVAVVSSGGIGGTSMYSVVFGVIFGVTVAVQLLLNLKALAIGPFSYTSVLVSLSTVIPTLSGLFWGEKIDLMQITGIILMVICIILSTDRNADDGSKKITARWLVCCLGSSVTNGLMGVMQKMHQTSAHKNESAVFLCVTMITLAAFALVTLLLTKVRNKNSENSKICMKLKLSHILIPVLAGVSLGLCHVINLNLSGRLEAAVLFPIVNICPLVLTTVAATVLFKERLSKLRWLGIAIGILSTLFVSGVMGSVIGKIIQYF